MKNDNPLVSIIVRTKDRPKLLKNAIKSIAAQNYRPIEIILVNDGGIEPPLNELKQILKNIYMKYIKSKVNQGRATAGNIGINNATGKYIGFLDDDDEFYPNHISVLVKHLQNSNTKVAYSDSIMVFKEFNKEKNKLITTRKELIYSENFNYYKLFVMNYIPLLCILFERDVLICAGGFDTDFELCEDWDLLIRLGGNHKFHHLKKVTAIVNQWNSNSQASYLDKDLNSPLKDYTYRKQACLKIISKHFNEYDKNKLYYFISEFYSMRLYLRKLERKNNIFPNYIKMISKISNLINYIKEYGLLAFLAKIKEKIISLFLMKSI